MKLIIKIIGIFILVLGFSFLIKPEYVFGWIEDNAKNQSLYIIAVVIRLILGFLFIISAKESKYPVFLKILGYIAILAAIGLIFIGQNGFQDLISSVFSHIKSYTAVIGLVALALGTFLIYAVSGNKELQD